MVERVADLQTHFGQRRNGVCACIELHPDEVEGLTGHQLGFLEVDDPSQMLEDPDD